MGEMRWWGWGEDAHAGDLPEYAGPWIEARIGAPLGPHAGPPALDAVLLPDPQLADGALAALRAIAGERGVHQDRAARVRHAAGRSYPDLLRLRAASAVPAPDAVVSAASHDQVAAILGACVAHGVAVVPFGGGTSVVGGVEPLRGAHGAVIALDLRPMAAVERLDARSRLAWVQPGLLGPELERELGARGHTLGHFPQSFEYSTVGGWVATRSAGQSSTGYGRIDDLVAGVRLAAPAGELDLPALPASAAGPDLRELVVGSEGILGVITQAALRIRPVPQERRYEAWMLPSFADGADALRTLVQHEVRPEIARVSDEPETEMSLALAGVRGAKGAVLGRYLGARGVAGGAFLLLGFEGEPDDVHRRRRATVQVVKAHRGVSLGTGPGQAWAAGRFHAPYLRDELLGRGVLVDTLETAVRWNDVLTLREAVVHALGAHAPFVACHISHIYPDGASLYFTYLAPQDRHDPLEQWRAAKHAASQAIVAHGATITHHHAVGTDHAPYLEAQDGALGLEALRAVKERLDPAGIMNPGKLVP